MKDYNPYSGVFWVPEDQLSPKLQDVLKLPDWELHYSLTQAIVDKVDTYYFPSISDQFYDEETNQYVKKEKGLLYLAHTQFKFIFAELPLTVKWNYVGLVKFWVDYYYLAFYPTLVSADGKGINSADEHGFGISNYFRRFDKELIQLIDLPYLFRPGGEKIVKLKGKKSPYKFKLASEDIGGKTKKKKKHPLLRSED